MTGAFVLQIMYVPQVLGCRSGIVTAKFLRLRILTKE